MAKKFSPLFILLLLTLISPSAFGQEAPSEFRFPVRAATYEIHGRLDLNRGAVSASQDVDYQLSEDPPAPAIWLELPDEVGADGKGERLIMDSLLVNGVPVAIGSILIQKKFLRIPLGDSLDGAVHLFCSFGLLNPALKVGRIGVEGASLENWYPRLIVDPILDQGVKIGTRSAVTVIADYAVELTADSSVTLAGAGEFRNAREHFGVLPDRGDTVLIDIAASALNHPRGISAARPYFWRSIAASGFGVRIYRQSVIDEAIGGGLKLRIYNGSRIDERRRVKVAETARQLLTYYSNRLGTPPNIEFAATYGSEAVGSRHYGTLLTLPRQARDISVVIAALAVQLAEQYFSPSRPEDSSRSLPWPEGAAVYAATEALFDLYEREGYRMMERFGDWQFPGPAIGQPMSRRSPFAWMETVRAPRFRRDRVDSLEYERLFVVPSALHAMSPRIGKARVWAALRRYSMETRHRFVGPNEFIESLVAQLGPGVSHTQFDQWLQYGARFDWSLDDVKLQPTYTGVILSGRIERSAAPAMPVEIGVIVPTGDTLSLSIVPDSQFVESRFLPFSVEVLDKPVAVVLDPYHYLPDKNRENNVYTFGQRPKKTTFKGNEYPAFRRLVRGG